MGSARIVLIPAAASGQSEATSTSALAPPLIREIFACASSKSVPIFSIPIMLQRACGLACVRARFVDGVAKLPILAECFSASEQA
jgi:hypothetical protein